MTSNGTGNHTFYCACCERQLPISRLAPTGLVNQFLQTERLCASCDRFLKMDLSFLTEKLEAKRLKISTATPRPAAPISQAVETDLPVSEPSEVVAHAAPSPPKPRRASSAEYNALHFQSLSIERFIDGFIQGLEAAGVDRAQLSATAVTAVNTLLGIKQTLTKQRRDANNESRATVRRLQRHLKETELIVEEYALAVTEECAPLKKGRQK